MEDRDFIDFEFNGHWASEFNLLAVSNSDRYSNSFYGTVNANTADMVGKYGVYKWKTQIGEKRFSINIAYDNVDLNTLRKIKEWLNPFVIGKLVFKEEPYKYYWVSLAEDPEISFLPFLTEEIVVDGRRLKKGVYKGEFVINFVCFDNYGYSDWNSFDENYDYIVKELEISDDEVNFDDGSDNSLIINQIDGNLKQNKESQAYYSTSQESNSLTLNNITNTDTEKWSIKGGNSQVVQNYNSTRVEGESFNLNDVDNSKTMDIQLKGNHSQETREGYNLLDLTSLIGKTETKNGITYKINEDCSITVNGAPTDYTSFKLLDMSLKAGTYKFVDGQNNYAFLQGIGSWNETSQNHVFSLTEDGDATIYLVVLQNTPTLNNFTLYPMIYEGTDDKPYEQYGASPSPDYPSEVETVKDSVEIKVVNKNFVKIDETIDFSISNVQFTYKDGKLNLNGTSNANISSVNNNFKNYFKFVLPAGSYTYSQKNSVNSNIFTYILDLEDTSKRYATANGNSVKKASFTLEKTTEVFVGMYSGSNVTFNNVEIELQIEKGLTATDFVEHQEQTAIMPIQQEMLEEDYFDWNNEREVHKFEKIVLNGNEDIRIREGANSKKIFGIAVEKEPIYTSGAEFKNIYCNMATASSRDTLFNTKTLNLISYGSANKYYNDIVFSFVETQNMTVDEFKAWVKNKYDAGTPIIVYYKLAEPIELNFTEKQKTAAKQFKAITPYKDITHIYSTDEIKPKMVVDYNITRAMPSLDYPSEIKTVSGKVENRVSNKQLYDVKDGGNASYLKENDYITLQADNTLGTSTSFINYFTKPSKIIKSNAYYYLIMEIKEVSGTGSIYPVSYYPSYNSQFQWFDEIRLENLKAGDVKVYKIQSLGDLTTSRTMLRTYAKFSKGESGSIKFRLSVFEKEPNIDKFVYTPFEKQSFIMPIQQDMLEGDYFDFDREKEIHGWIKVVLDDTKILSQEATNTDGKYRYALNLKINFINKQVENCSLLENTAYCNRLKLLRKGETHSCIEGFTVTNNVLWIYTDGSTLDEFKTKLANNQMIFYVPLVNNDEITFTSEQKTVARQLKRSNFYKGTTNVILDNDLAKVKVNYDGYDGAPSEKHPSSVDGVKDGVEITVKNKNILPIPNSSNTSMGLTSTYSNGVYQITGTPVTNWTLLFQKLKQPIKKGKYTLSYEVEGEKYQLEPTFIYKNGEIERKWIHPSIKKQTIDLKDDVESLTLGLSGFTINQAVNITLKIQLERGEEATEIVVPEQQKVSLPVQEEMYIGDYIDETGEHHKMTKIVIDGTNIRVSMTKKPANFIQTYLSTSEQFDPQVDIKCYSNIMKQEYNARFGFVNTFIKGKTGIYFHFKGDLLGDADCNDIGMNNWFKEQYDKGTPAYIIGPLKKEKMLPLTDEQKSALNILKNYTYSYPGANTISISGDTKPKITASYIPQQDINIDFILEGSNLLNDSAFYYNNNIYLKAFDEIDSGNPSTSGISSEREVYLYNAGNVDASLKLTFDLIIPAENSPLTIVTSKGRFTKNGFEEINSYSQFSISNFAHYKPFVDIFDGVLSNWVIEIDSDLCEVYLKHKTNKDKVINLNRFNDNQSFLKLAGSDFVDYSKSFPTSLEEIKDSAIENTIFNKISLKESAQNYRLKNVSLDWKHTYL